MSFTSKENRKLLYNGLVAKLPENHKSELQRAFAAVKDAPYIIEVYGIPFSIFGQLRTIVAQDQADFWADVATDIIEGGTDDFDELARSLTSSMEQIQSLWFENSPSNDQVMTMDYFLARHSLQAEEEAEGSVGITQTTPEKVPDLIPV